MSRGSEGGKSGGFVFVTLMSPRRSKMPLQSRFLAKSAWSATLTFWDSGKLEMHFSTLAERFFLKSAVVGLECNYYMASRWNTMHLGEVNPLLSEALSTQQDAAGGQVFLPFLRSIAQLEGLVMHLGRPPGKRWRCSTGLDRTPPKGGRERPWVAPRPRHPRAFGLPFWPFCSGPLSSYYRPRKRGRIRERFATWKNDLTPGFTPGFTPHRSPLVAIDRH